MNKELLISIKPEHLVNILNGQKTRELRTRVPKHYKGWVNIYCTKSKKQFRVGSLGFYEDVLYKLPNGQIKFGFPYEDEKKIFLNGKVVARFWFDEYDIYLYDGFFLGGYFNDKETLISEDYKLPTEICLTQIQMIDYGKGKPLYAWHIKKLEVFDTPKSLSDFVSDKLVVNVCGNEFKCYSETASYFARKDQRITKAPQSYQFVYVKEKLK